MNNERAHHELPKMYFHTKRRRNIPRKKKNEKNVSWIGIVSWIEYVIECLLKLCQMFRLINEMKQIFAAHTA